MKKLEARVSHITIEVNSDRQAGYTLHVPSDESISEFNNWFFNYDFGDWSSESFETTFYTVIQVSLSNKNNDYSKVNELVEVIETEAKRILKK